MTSQSSYFPIAAMAVGSDGSVVVVGSTDALDLATTPGVVQPKPVGRTCMLPPSPPGTINPGPAITFPCTDGFIMKLDGKGNVVFATYLGGNGMDAATSVALDSDGNIYVAGTTQVNYTSPSIPAVDFPTTPGALYTQRSMAPADGFVAKLNPTGTKLIYSTLIPAMVNASIRVDSAGSVYLAGMPMQLYQLLGATDGAYQTAFGNGFLAKLNATGTRFQYATYLPTYMTAFAVDAAGDVFFTGLGAMEATDGSTPSVNGRVPIAELNPTGTALVYSSLFGGTDPFNADSGSAIRLDAQGNVYIFGGVGTPNFPTTPGAFQQTIDAPPWAAPANGHTFVAKLRPGGHTVVYSTYFSSAVAFDVDPSGNVYVVAKAIYGFPTTNGATRRCMAGGESDLVIAKLAPDGSLAAATYLGGSGKDSTAPYVRTIYSLDPQLLAMGVGPDGSVYVAGGTDSPDFPGAMGQSINANSSFTTRLQIADPNKIDAPCIGLTLANSANLIEGPIVAGELVTLRGLGIGPDNGVVPPSGSTIPTTVAGTRVLFDGIPAPILYTQSQQINVQAPFEISGPATHVHIEYNGASSDVSPIPVQNGVLPSIFKPNSFTGQAIATNEDGSLNSISNPAATGSIVTLWGTGGGQFNPIGLTGGVNPLTSSASISLPVKVGIGNFLPRADCEVLYAGPAPGLSSGVFQINFRVPANLPSIEFTFLTVTIGGVAETETVYGTYITLK